MNEMYLISVRTLERLKFQFIPNEIRQDLTGGYSGVVIIGRNLPRQAQGANEDTLHFQLDFHSDEENREDVRDKCNWLRSLKYTPGNFETSGKVRLLFGQLYKDSLWVVDRVSVRYSQFNKVIGLLPQQAYVDITLKLDPDENITDQDVR